MGERSTFVTTWTADREDAQHLKAYFEETNYSVSAHVVEGPDGVFYVTGWLKAGPAPYEEYHGLMGLEPYKAREGAQWYGSPYITILCDGGPDTITGSLIRDDYVVHSENDMLDRDKDDYGVRVTAP